MEAGIGVNSPEFLQKKIDRLKTALDEANVLMDRQVTERDEARAQLEAARRENAELKRQLEAGGATPAAAPAEPAAPAVDPAVEQGLRDRIAELERERDALAVDKPDGEQELLAQIQDLQGQLEAARRDLTAARSDTDTARRDAEAARATVASLPGRTESSSDFGSVPDSELPATGPFVSQEVIRAALDNDNFVLFCQPVFSLQSERITQYELLLRLRDGDGRMVRPFGFLEPADRYGMMSEIDRWVVGHALDLLTADVTGDLRLEVNLAAQSLSDPELTALIEQQISVTDLDPG
ncbi:MAG: hypothetical protein QOJ29_5423, partial [Thermoleophilaceae bacterium]|nr:hypothetical protein [Thermoleophilaceae bacterium]